MPDSAVSPVHVIAGTRDGLYICSSDENRLTWSVDGPYLRGMDVSHATQDSRDGTLWAAANAESEHGVYRRRDGESDFELAGEPFEVERMWHVEPGPEAKPGLVYAGADPACLYESRDCGNTWQPVRGFAEHPSRDEWWPGGGGMCLHTIITNPANPDEIVLGMSVAGVFQSLDGGQTWEPRNAGTISMASEWAEMTGKESAHDVHRCTHKAVRHPSNGVIFQQNHLGVYRSDNLADGWIDISDGLPDRFGFVIDATSSGAVFVVPQHDWTEESGVRVSGQLAVYRSRDNGTTWQRLDDGLPEVENVTLYREGMATDRLDPGGVYIGTSDGEIYHSRDEGDHWTTLASGLPPIRSLACGHRPI